MSMDRSYNYNKNFGYKNQIAVLDGQRPNIDLSVGVRLQSASSWANRYLSVTLTGTNVSADGDHNPPRLVHDDSTQKGWYTQSVLVTMSLDDSSIFRKNDGPVTTGASVTVTSGTSEQMGANAGAFGAAPMVGIQGGISLSQSISESIPDFSISNNSNETKISQLFYLSSSSAGHYANAFSLEDQSGFHQPYYVTPPEKALSGLAINSQAIWATPDANYDKKTTLTIKLEHTLAKVWMERYGLGDLSAHMHSQWRKFRWNVTYPVDFSQVNP